MSMVSDRIVRKMAVNVLMVYLGFAVSAAAPIIYSSRAGLASSIAINVSILAALAVFGWLAYAAHVSNQKPNRAETEPN